MFGFNREITYELPYTNAIIHHLMTRGRVSTYEFMKLRCNGKKMAAVSTYISKARQKLVKTGYTIKCERVGENYYYHIEPCEQSFI